MTHRRIFVLAVLAGLAVRWAHLSFIRDHPFYRLLEVWPDSDMYQFAAWAKHLASGDWLDAETFRPFFSWQEGIATREVWNSWFGAHVYYQPPLYPYLAAAVLAATGSLDTLRLGQAALGALNCGLAAVLASRLYGAAAGWLAGAAAALYAPFILYDAELLRGTVVITTQLLLLSALARGHEGRAHPGWSRSALVAGLSFGISYLADPVIVVFLPLALGWIWWSATMGGVKGAALASRAAVGLKAPALFLAGAAMALAPLAARNIAVGAPLLSSTTRGPLAFVMGNAPDANPAGAFIPQSTGAILHRSGYGMGSTISETLRLYQGDYAALRAKQWSKLEALWGAYEIPDNPSFYYAARVSPAVAYGLRFLPVAALGLVGLAVSIRPALRDPAMALVPLHLLACNLIFLLAHVVSRYRQPMAMALVLLAGRAVAVAIGGGRVAGFGVPAAAVALLFCLPWAPPAGYAYDRRTEYVLSAELFAQRGQIERAAAEINDLIGRARAEPQLDHDVPGLLYKLGTMQAAAYRHEDAVASFRAALQEDPQYGEAAEALAASEAALQRRGSRPEAP